jgi:hypothetical protein
MLINAFRRVDRVSRLCMNSESVTKLRHLQAPSPPFETLNSSRKDCISILTDDAMEVHTYADNESRICRTNLP